jgi:uncharacterized protein YdhG (YjbR/CyaY superfamily)
MKASKPDIETVDDYIAGFPKNTRAKLESLRAAIRSAAPGVEERISYRMPAFALEGNLVYFAAFKDHIGFFPTSSGVEAFRKELAAYATSTGTVRFRLDRPLPLGLVKRIVRFRVEENSRKARPKRDKS